ncbi:MAG: HAMP domain-containing sensor histidine kinase [Bacteroidota bacterium]
MDIYTQKSRWKLYLALTALVILVISSVYTNYIAERLAEGERDKVELYANALKSLVGDTINVNRDVTFEQQVLSIVKDIPVILVNETGQISSSQNFPDGADLESELAKIKSNGLPPLESSGYARYIYYKHTRLLTLLTYFPILQVLLLLLFVSIGYILFSSARKSEQNQVWVGMAKETAHQLGTPITAILGWIEHLRAIREDDEEVHEVLNELNNDVSRLDLIADRFSKIGSAPELVAVNVFEELEKCRQYMERRASRKIKFEFPEDSQPLEVNINPHLFAWVIENLLRNALDAMGGKGKISAAVYAEKGFVNIDVSDTGKGIPPSKFKTVFQPGFTTKKRGWGLGLSLAKRIIESYHSGKIFVKKSGVNEGTTFTIKLPKD